LIDRSRGVGTTVVETPVTPEWLGTGGTVFIKTERDNVWSGMHASSVGSPWLFLPEEAKSIVYEVTTERHTSSEAMHLQMSVQEPIEM
jgi:hypothetical protein